MTDIAKLTVGLYANSAQFATTLEKSRRQAKGWGDAVKGIMAHTAAATAASAAATAGAITLLYNQQAAIIDQTAKLADSLGISTEAYTQLRHAANLTGAAETFDSAMESMVVKLGEATLGTGAAKEAMDMLGLSAEAMGEKTPDQQLLALADALQQVENQSQRTFITDEIFGGPEMMVMLNQGAAGIKAMTDEADRLGITLSRVDAAKIEMANDAMFKIGQVQKGLYQSMATELAPFVAQLSEDLLTYINHMGGMGNVTVSVLESVAHAAAYVGDIYRGWTLILGAVDVAIQQAKLGFMGFYNAIAISAPDIQKTLLEAFTYPLRWALYAASHFSEEAAALYGQLEGYVRNIKPITPFDDKAINDSRLEIGQAIWELQRLAAEPMPSDGVEAWFNNTRAKIQEAAELYAGGLNRNKTGNAGNLLTDVGIADANKATVDSFKATTDRIGVEYQRRLVLMAAGEEQAATQEAFAYQDRQIALAQEFEKAYEAAANNQATQQALEDEYFAAREVLWQDHQSRLTQIEKDASQMRAAQQAAEMAAYSNLFGSMADITKAFAGEQSGLYKAMFVASKGFAIAESIIKIQQGLANAAAMPYPTNLGAIATVASATSGIISTIQGVQLSGMAHSGIDAVPDEGTWLLDKGERVYTNDSAKRIDQMYSAVMGGGKGGGTTVKQTVHFHLDGNADDPQTLQRLAEMVRQITMETLTNEQRAGGMLYG